MKTAQAIAREIVFAYRDEALTVALAVVREVSEHNASVAANNPTPLSAVETVETIVATAAAYFGVTKAKLIGFSRTRATSRSRHVLWWLLRRRLRMSLPELGTYFNRDHTTVYAALKGFKPSKDVVAISKLLNARRT